MSSLSIFSLDHSPHKTYRDLLLADLEVATCEKVKKLFVLPNFTKVIET